MLSIVKRANALGLLAHRDEFERYTRTAGELRSLVMIAFGGMAAEELMFGEAGTGPAGDLAAATRLAVEMVGAYGMADSYISYGTAEEMFSGNLASKVLGDVKGRKAVDRILDQAKAAAAEVLRDHRHIVVSLRNALLEKEELSEHEIAAVIAASEHNEHDLKEEDRVLVDLRDAQDRIRR
jgi:ATP-dependent Zn protease